jgi:glycogen debranching enzyme
MDVKYGNVDEVLATIQSAQANYAKRRDGSQARESLTQLSEKLMFYTGVMDVIVNQHPEYTALAWGAMKFLLIVC